MRDKDSEETMKKWISQNIEVIWRNQIQQRLADCRSNPKRSSNWENDFESKLELEIEENKRQFKRDFEKLSENNVTLYNEQENSMQQHLNLIKQEFLFELKQDSHQRKIKIYNIQGDDRIKDSIREAKKAPNLTYEEKKRLFEEAWASIEDKSGLVFDRQKEAGSLFNLIHERYQNSLNSITGGLPKKKEHYSLDYSVSDIEYQNQLKQNILNRSKNHRSGGLEESKTTLALVLRGGKGNISFKYFDMRKYYQKVSVNENVVLNYIDISSIFDESKLRNKLVEILPVKDRIKFLSQEISKEFLLFNIKVWPDSLQEYLNYEMKLSFTKRFVTKHFC